MSKGDVNTNGCTALGCLGLIAIVVLVPMVTGGGEEKTAPPQIATPLPESTVSQCVELLQNGANIRVIRKEDQAAKRLYVDQRLWQELGPDGRKGITGAAACKWFRLGMSDTTFDDRVTVVSFQTGKRLSFLADGLYIDSAD